MSDKEIELETFVQPESEGHDTVSPDAEPLERSFKLFGYTMPMLPEKYNIKLKSGANHLAKYAWRKKFSIVLSVLILVLLCSLGYCLYRIKLSDDGTIYVKNTMEFQITNLGSMKTWYNRTSIVEQWIATFNENSKMIQLDINDGETLIRNEYSLSVDMCGVSTYIRVREYLTGSSQGTSTLDIKGNSKIHWRACVYPYWPPLDKVSNSSQKCEKDIHECDSKYSRETRIYLEDFKTYDVCDDVFKYFPFAGSDQTKANEPIKKNEDEPWYIYKYTGSVGDSDYEISFTLRYHHEGDAMNETNPPFDGEWSIRITSTEHGYSDEWDEDFEADVQQTYDALVKEFSHETCHFL